MGYIASSRPARELYRETLSQKPTKKVKKKRKKIRNGKKRIAKNSMIQVKTIVERIANRLSPTGEMISGGRHGQKHTIFKY